MNKKNIFRVLVLAILVVSFQIFISCESSSGMGKNSDGNLSGAHSSENLNKKTHLSSENIFDFNVNYEYDSEGNLSINDVYDPYEA